jgi:hypothetical protein
MVENARHITMPISIDGFEEVAEAMGTDAALRLLRRPKRSASRSSGST